MSTKLRYILTGPGFNYTNARALYSIKKLITKVGFDPRNFPNWNTYSKVQKLECMLKYLPNTFQVFVIRERRNNRKNRSVVSQLLGQGRIAARAVDPHVVVQAPQAQAQQQPGRVMVFGNGNAVQFYQDEDQLYADNPPILVQPRR